LLSARQLQFANILLSILVLLLHQLLIQCQQHAHLANFQITLIYYSQNVISNFSSNFSFLNFLLVAQFNRWHFGVKITTTPAFMRHPAFFIDEVKAPQDD